MCFNKVFLLAVICFLLAGSAALVNGCGDDDDDDDDSVNGSGQDDDDNDVYSDDDDVNFQCGEDMQCHENHVDCLIDCETLDCPANICAPAYRDCLDPDGCTRPYLDCKDNCGDDEGCLDGCETNYAACFAAECDADEVCLSDCFDDFDECTAECGAAVGCYLACLATYEGCFWGCLPY